MKFLFALLSFLLMLPAFAYMNEVECMGTTNGARVMMDIERPFPNGSITRRAYLTAEGQYFTYFLVGRRIGLSMLEYSSPDTRLVLDLWPDNRPTWGRTYRADLSSRDVRNGQNISLSCRFPFAD